MHCELGENAHSSRLPNIAESLDKLQGICGIEDARVDSGQFTEQFIAAIDFQSMPANARGSLAKQIAHVFAEHNCFVGLQKCKLRAIVLQLAAFPHDPAFHNKLHWELCRLAIIRQGMSVATLAAGFGYQLCPLRGFYRARVFIYDILHSLGRRSPRICLDLVLAVAETCPDPSRIFGSRGWTKPDLLMTATKQSFQSLVDRCSTETQHISTSACTSLIERNQVHVQPLLTLQSLILEQERIYANSCEIHALLRAVSLKTSLTDPSVVYDTVASTLWPLFVSCFSRVSCCEPAHLGDELRRASRICRILGTVIGAVSVDQRTELHRAFDHIQSRLTDFLVLRQGGRRMQPAIALALIDALNSRQRVQYIADEQDADDGQGKQVSALHDWRKRVSSGDLARFISGKELDMVDSFLRGSLSRVDSPYIDV